MTKDKIFAIIVYTKTRGDDIMLTQYQLEMYAKKFLKDNYNLEMEIPLELNGRMSKTLGWFRYTQYRDGRKIANRIQLNKHFVENNDPITVVDVLRHELVHYALFMLGKPNSDGHPVFENELKRLGIVSQDTINKYEIKSKPKRVTIYECVNCGHEYKRSRALPHDGKYHSCGITGCNGDLINKGRRMVAS